jgi:hypothetical protein
MTKVGSTSRPRWTHCGLERRLTPEKPTPMVHWITSQVRELYYIHPHDVTYATFCQGRYQGRTDLA